MIWFILLVLLILLPLLAVPAWPYSRGWGYWPAGLLIALLVLYLLLIWWGAVALWYPWAAAT